MIKSTGEEWPRWLVELHLLLPALADTLAHMDIDTIKENDWFETWTKDRAIEIIRESFQGLCELYIDNASERAKHKPPILAQDSMVRNS